MIPYQYITATGLSESNSVSVYYSTPTALIKCVNTTDMNNKQLDFPATSESTYKDFYYCGVDGDKDNKEISGIYIKLSELKQEGIKWVKEIIKEQERRGRWIKGSKCNQSQMSPRKQGQMSFIKRFFNLTEEDLK